MGRSRPAGGNVFGGLKIKRSRSLQAALFPAIQGRDLKVAATKPLRLQNQIVMNRNLQPEHLCDMHNHWRHNAASIVCQAATPFPDVPVVP